MPYGSEEIMAAVAMQEQRRRERERSVANAIAGIGDAYRDAMNRRKEQERYDAAQRLRDRGMKIEEDRLGIAQENARRIARQDEIRALMPQVEAGMMNVPGYNRFPEEGLNRLAAFNRANREKADLQTQLAQERQAAQDRLLAQARALDIEGKRRDLATPPRDPVADAGAIEAARRKAKRDDELSRMNPLSRFLADKLGLWPQAGAGPDPVEERRQRELEANMGVLRRLHPDWTDAQVEGAARKLWEPESGPNSLSDPIGRLATRAALADMDLSGEAPSPERFSAALEDYDRTLRGRFGGGPRAKEGGWSRFGLFRPRAPFIMPGASEQERRFAGRYGYPDVSGMVEPAAEGSLLFDSLRSMNASQDATASGPAQGSGATPGKMTAPAAEGAADWPLLRRYLESQKKLSDAELMPWVRDLQANPTREKIELLRAMRAGR